MADNPYGPPPPQPGLPPGMGGPIPDEAPPRPWWETALLALCGLCLAPFFFPDTVIAPNLKLAVGLTATALLIWVFARRIRALRGKFIQPQEELRVGQPRPYHLPPRHDSRKR